MMQDPAVRESPKPYTFFGSLFLFKIPFHITTIHWNVNTLLELSDFFSEDNVTSQSVTGTAFVFIRTPLKKMLFWLIMVFQSKYYKNFSRVFFFELNGVVQYTIYVLRNYVEKDQCRLYRFKIFLKPIHRISNA